MRYLVLNGPNLNLLGEREPEIYGNSTLADVEALLCTRAEELSVAVEFFQTNHEGAIIDKLQEARTRCAGVIYNPGAHAHYSYAIRDAIASIDIPVVEVHITDITKRESFRHVSVLAPVCYAQISGQGVTGYVQALDLLVAPEE